MKNNKKLLGIVIAFFVIMMMVGISGCTSGSDDGDDGDDDDINNLIAAYCSVEYGAQSDNVAYPAVSPLQSTYDVEGLQ